MATNQLKEAFIEAKKTMANQLQEVEAKKATIVTKIFFSRHKIGKNQQFRGMQPFS